MFQGLEKLNEQSWKKPKAQIMKKKTMQMFTAITFARRLVPRRVAVVVWTPPPWWPGSLSSLSW
jgi:hypothetical protein